MLHRRPAWWQLIAIVVGLRGTPGQAASPPQATPLPLPAGFHASVITKIDADGDQRTDLFVGNADGGPDRLLLNRKGGWSDLSLDTGRGRTLAAAVADFNRDGHEDIVIGKSTGLVLAMGDGKGGFSMHTLNRDQARAWSLAAADLNSDGWIDLIAGRRAAGGTGSLVWLNDRTPGPVPHFHPAGTIAGCCDIAKVALADLRIDGYLDLAVLHDNGSIDAYINDSEGHLAAHPGMLPAGPWNGMVVHDVDNNVAADVLLYRQPADGSPAVYRLLHNDGQARFNDVTAASGLKVDGPITAAWWVDANTDGLPDLMLADPDGALKVVPQTGNLKFGKATVFETGGLVAGPLLTIGDLAQRGDFDLVAPALHSPLALFNAGSQRHHWLGVRLSAKGHASVLGSFVVLTRPDGSVVTDQLTASDPLLLRLGWRAQVSVMAIYWVNGIISRFHPDRVDRYWDFTQPDNPYRSADKPAAP